MTDHPLSGVYAASLTPLNTDASRPDLEAVAPYLAFLASRGCHGALLFGTTGEGPSFSPEERKAVWQAALTVREQYPRFRLLAGTGTPSLTETIDLTRAAFNLGFDGVVTLPPYYFRKASDDGLFEWFAQVIQRAVPTDGYLLGYHFPGVAGIGFSIDLLKRLKDAFPVQFAGIKDSSHDAAFTVALGQTFGADLAVFAGNDADLTFALQNRAAGCITAPANLLSPALRAIYDAYCAEEQTPGFLKEPGGSSSLQETVSHQRHILDNYPPFPPTLKALVHRLHGQPRWPVRPPLVAMTRESEATLLNDLQVR
jgi:4-hydroxy-tetrahydrodipicolinate synthase